MSNLIHIDNDYKDWIESLSKQFKQHQIKAAVRVNQEILSFYWQLGKDIVELDIENRWGKCVIKSISDDLKSELPDVKGLSPTNLYYAKWFYLTYNQYIGILPQVGVKSEPDIFTHLFSIPWTIKKKSLKTH